MSKTNVTAIPLQGFRVLKSEDKPNAAVLALEVRGTTQYYLMPRDKLKDLADHLSKAAETMGGEAKPQTLS